MISISLVRRLFLFWLALALSTAAVASGPSFHFSVTQGFVPGDPDQSRPAAGTLTRSARDLSLRLSAAELHGGHVYTAWWLIFNAPQHCQNPMGSARCGGPDIDDPKVKGAILWAAGGIADDAGTLQLAGRLRKGKPPEGWTVSPRGMGRLLDPREAEVHLLLVRHPAAGDLGEMIDEAMTTPDAGCGGGCPGELGFVFLP